MLLPHPEATDETYVRDCGGSHGGVYDVYRKRINVRLGDAFCKNYPFTAVAAKFYTLREACDI